MFDVCEIGGAGCIIQFDESLFQIKRKYNRGRLLYANNEPQDTDNTETEDDDDDDNIRNYGK